MKGQGGAAEPRRRRRLGRALSAAPKRRGWSPEKELLLYIAHGMDHLSGADDYAPEDYRRMRRRELAWIKSLVL